MKQFILFFLFIAIILCSQDSCLKSCKDLSEVRPHFKSSFLSVCNNKCHISELFKEIKEIKELLKDMNKNHGSFASNFKDKLESFLKNHFLETLKNKFKGKK